MMIKNPAKNPNQKSA